MTGSRQYSAGVRNRDNYPTVTANFDPNLDRFNVQDSGTSYNSGSKHGRRLMQQESSWPVQPQQDWLTSFSSKPTQDSQNTWLQSTADYYQPASRYSSKGSVTFRLNLDIQEKPEFIKEANFAQFRTREIVPTADEILDSENNETEYTTKPGAIPHVPINRVKGAYDSVDHYLHTHFELLRNDCLIPLQNAVRSYRESLAYQSKDNDGSLSVKGMGDQAAPREFRVYEHVHLNAIVFGGSQAVYRVSFRLPYYIRVNWPLSKRLIEGSLVLLSKDNFKKDVKVATVVQRGDEPMRGSNRFEYMIDIYLERDNDDMPLGFGDPLLLEQDQYVMIEATNGYFEAYRHVLSVLKGTPPDKLPFADTLVHQVKAIRIPHYAAIRRYYDIDTQHKNNSAQSRKPVDVLGVWPDHQTGMDKTQMDALKTILSHDVAIVQGPPGTGKTFVGAYAMRVLLSNFDKSLGPIVCICQTNHALDQFLEHILTHDDRIVRVGSRSKSDMLKDHTLYELRKQSKGIKGVGRLYRKRDELAKKIRGIVTEMYEDPFVSIDFLRKKKALSSRQLDSLARMAERGANRDMALNISEMDDSDEEWVVSSEPHQPSLTLMKNAGGARNPKDHQDNQERQVNPIEIWIQDAVSLLDENDGPLSTFADDLKEELLEQQKGLVFDDETEDELEEDDEIKEITISFREDYRDIRGNKNPFVNIGQGYGRNGGGSPLTALDRSGNNTLVRKVINYNKFDSAKAFDPNKFDFFQGDIDEQALLELEEQHYVLERWIKVEDIAMWPLPVRVQAHKRWVKLRNQEHCAAIRSLMRQYDQTSEEIRRCKILSDAQICRENRVVGMTSTAAAKYHDLLEAIQPRILFVEEAAEMLEAHIVTALTRTLQHVVLIGDHQQLRPSTAVHTLAESHYLNVSLFERLVMNEFPFTRLSHQRRMHPEIRVLIDPIYSDPPLKDHTDVYRYPPVRGMKHSIYFLSHEEPESHLSETASKCNDHEAQMVAKLSTYLLMQGYSTSDITIITMYSGQRSAIKNALRQEQRPFLDPTQIRVSSVDGFQGEENKIIILSLVRSNSSSQIGFLKVANRVCVSLSRAKHGMYIIGNARLLCEGSNLWNEIIANLEDAAQDRISTKLKLQCAKHNAITEVQWPVDFADVEEGGCARLCSQILDCGHQCILKCHAYDHDRVKCQQPCRRLLDECGHPCARHCYAKCGPCQMIVRKRLVCGHDIQGECGKIRRLQDGPPKRQCPICSNSISQ